MKMRKWKLSCLTLAMYFCATLFPANSILPGLDAIKLIPNVLKKTNTLLKGVNEIVPKDLEEKEEKQKDYLPTGNVPVPTEAAPKRRRKRDLSADCKGRDTLAEKAMMRTVDMMRTFDPMGLSNALMGKLGKGVLKGLRTLSNTTSVKVFCDDKSAAIETTLLIKTMNISYIWMWNPLDGSIVKVWVNAENVQLGLTALVDNSQVKPHILLNCKLMNPQEDFDIGYSGLEPFNFPLETVQKTLYGNFKENTVEAIDEVIEDVFFVEYIKVMRSEGKGKKASSALE